MNKSTRKIIVLDTSVLLYDKNCIENFSGCDVVLPLVVLDEIDSFKEKPGLLGESARHVNRFLDKLRAKGSLHEGVQADNDVTVTIKLRRAQIPPGFPLDPKDNDNKIVLEALEIKRTLEEEKVVIVVTKDVNLRVKCDALQIIAEDYYNDYIDLPEESWNGIVEIEVNDSELINKLYSDKEIDYECDLSPNTFVVLKTVTGQFALCVWNARSKKMQKINDVDVKPEGSLGISGKNKEQKFALWALFNDKLPLVSMTGLAGSGKTFISLMAGITQVQKEKYERIIITRNIQPVGKEIGYLPGDMNDKMMPWMGPVIDNLRNHFKDKKTFDLMHTNGLIEIAPMSFIRGRTFTNSYIILDEAQNATIHELKTVITRVGEGSKIVLMGDTDQIDTPYIDKETNGLSLVTKKLRCSHHTAHIHLPVGIRSTIASEASYLL